MHLVHDMLRRHAHISPERAMLLSPEGQLRYGEAEQAASRLAAALARLGGGTGDRVGLALPKRMAYILAYFGILKAGAVVVPIRHDLSVLDHAAIAGRSSARLAIVTASVARVLPAHPARTVVVADESRDDRGEPAAPGAV